MKPVEDRRNRLDPEKAPNNQRRSQRVVAAVAIEVKWTTEEGFTVTALARTDVFNAHGALINIKSPLIIPPDIQICRPDHTEAIRARVVDAGSFSPNVPTRVAIELEQPSETVWGIVIPPLDNQTH